MLCCEQVSAIVEADPEVLGDKYVQTAVEGRFCDSAISVRETALDLVGKYIASHPNVAVRVMFFQNSCPYALCLMLYFSVYILLFACFFISTMER